MGRPTRPLGRLDRWIEGDERAISDSAKRGFDLFNSKAHCSACHSGWAFTDASFHDIGTATGDDIGRGQLFPNSPALRYAFKTPTLRDVARRPPYMHDGSVATLSDVIDLYNRGGIDRPSRAEEIKPLGLTEQEKADLVAFMRTYLNDPQHVRSALATKPALKSLGDDDRQRFVVCVRYRERKSDGSYGSPKDGFATFVLGKLDRYVDALKEVVAVCKDPQFEPFPELEKR